MKRKFWLAGMAVLCLVWWEGGADPLLHAAQEAVTEGDNVLYQETDIGTERPVETDAPEGIPADAHTGRADETVEEGEPDEAEETGEPDESNRAAESDAASRLTPFPVRKKTSERQSAMPSVRRKIRPNVI